MGILKVRLDFDQINNKLNVYDLVAAAYTGYGYTLSNIKGLLKIVGIKTGVIYKNIGWDDDDLTSPDIISDTWSYLDIPLPIESTGEIVLQSYDVYYKVSFDGVSIGEVLSKSFLNGYTSPVVKYNTLVSIFYSTIDITDITEYDITFNSNTYTPTQTSKNIHVVWPVGSGQPDTDELLGEITLGPDIWTGSYEITLTSSLNYLLVNDADFVVNMIDAIDKQSYISVVASSFDESVAIALNIITSEYEYEKEHDLSMASYWQNVLDELMMYYDIYRLSYEFGDDTGIAARRIYEIINDKANSLMLSITIDVEEIFPWAPVAGGEIGTPGGLIYYGT